MLCFGRALSVCFIGKERAMYIIRHLSAPETYFCGFQAESAKQVRPDWKQLSQGIASIPMRVFGNPKLAQEIADEIGGEVVPLQEALVVH